MVQHRQCPFTISRKSDSRHFNFEGKVLDLSLGLRRPALA